MDSELTQDSGLRDRQADVFPETSTVTESQAVGISGGDSRLGSMSHEEVFCSEVSGD